MGIGVGEGFNDGLMNAFTDKGRGAYVFLDAPREIERLLEPRAFVSAFDLAVKNVRLKMVMPPGWRMTAFHGEQVSAVASEVIPQYLAPGDQMIYHLVVASTRPAEEARAQSFAFEAEFTPLGGKPDRLAVQAPVGAMLAPHRQILKGDAVVEYAELLKKVRWPLEANRAENLADLDAALSRLEAADRELRDPEIARDPLPPGRLPPDPGAGGAVPRRPGPGDRQHPTPCWGSIPRQVRGAAVRGPAAGAGGEGAEPG